MASVTVHTESVVLRNGLPSTPAAPGSYFGFGLNAPVTQSSGQRIYAGTGNPNGVLTAPAGSIWLDSTGVVYINTNGALIWSVMAAPSLTNVIADPGTGVAIPVTASGTINITVGAGAETNTLANPTFVGQQLTINEDTSGGGTRVITLANAGSYTGGTFTTATFNAARDLLSLQAITVGGALRWAAGGNLNVVLA